MATGLPAEPLRKLKHLAERSKRKTSVRFPISFVRQEVAGEVPPLARLVRGKGVRLHLYLTLALMATRTPYDIKTFPPARYLADALGLPDSHGRGARRVTEALTWLHKEGFIVRSSRKGKPPHVVVQYPGSESLTGGRYVSVPLGLWEQGWILRLSARALGLYLVLTEASGGSATNTVKLSGSRKAQYCLSDETWARAAEDLQAENLLDVEQVFAKASDTDEYEPKRRRQQYTLLNAKLISGPLL